MSGYDSGVIRNTKSNGNVLSQVLIAMLILGLVSMVSSAQADDNYYDNRSIRGDWGFSASGTIVPPAFDAATPAVAVGTISFYGPDECLFTDTINIGGTATSRTSTQCTYNVGTDGMGTIEVSFPGDPGPTPLSFVIVSDMKEIRFIRTDLGVASGVAKRQGDDHD